MKPEITRLALVLAGSLFSIAAAGDVGKRLFDFETEENIKSAPRLVRPTYRFGVTNFCASGGNNAFGFSARPWQEKDYDWPAFTLKPSVRDWSAYDRLVIDVVNLGDDGDIISMNIAEPEGRPDRGLSRSLALPAWKHVRWTVDLKYWPQTCSPTNITRIQIYTFRPQSMNVYMDGFTLLKPGESMPPAPKYGSAALAAIKQGRAAYDRKKKARHDAFIADLAAANAKAGLKSKDFLIGRASSMDGVRPRDTFSAKGPTGFDLRLARNETEAMQLLVTPLRKNLSGVKVEISPMRLENPADNSLSNDTRLPAGAVTAVPVGYVETTSRPRYRVGYNVKTEEAPGYKRMTKRTPLGWWPDPILDFLDSVDVKKGDVQSFWISARIPESAVPGLYRGAIRVSARGCRSVLLPVTVKVDPFAIPAASPIPMLVSFSPSIYIRPDQHGARDREFRDAAMAKPDSPINLWKTKKMEWGEFLADRFVTMAPLYQHNLKTELPYDVWARLKAQGRMGPYNLCYFSSQPNTPERLKKWTQWSDWVASVIEQRYKEAVQHGIEEHAVVYCCDEARTNRFPEIDAVLGKLKKRFPQIKFATTSFDDSFGTAGTLKDVDIFIPQTIKFDPAIAEKSRAAGNEVWWYYACDQKAPLANAFTEGQPIEQRLMMGAKAARWRPDGFLYYQISYFNSLDCITSGPYTSWNPRSWWGEHGDATWVAVGPGGKPLTTQRFENFRDGVEDLWYAELLRKKLRDNPDASWADRAKELLAVPRSVVDTLENYTDDADAVYAWRNAMADLLSL